MSRKGQGSHSDKIWGKEKKGKKVKGGREKIQRVRQKPRERQQGQSRRTFEDKAWQQERAENEQKKTRLDGAKQLEKIEKDLALLTG